MKPEQRFWKISVQLADAVFGARHRHRRGGVFQHRDHLRDLARVESVAARPASFAYSADGKKFLPIGNELKMGLGLPWTANRFALFNFSTSAGGVGGCADFNWFHFKGEIGLP